MSYWILVSLINCIYWKDSASTGLIPPYTYFGFVCILSFLSELQTNEVTDAFYEVAKTSKYSQIAFIAKKKLTVPYHVGTGTPFNSEG
jgi:hypothetical protein